MTAMTRQQIRARIRRNRLRLRMRLYAAVSQ